MAKTLDTSGSVSHVVGQTHALQSLGLLRLLAGGLILVGSFLTVLGTSWDIQWHAFVGRDRTLIPPHVMSLVGITICGLTALIAVVLETSWVRRDPRLQKYATGFADLFQSSLGTYIAGYAALTAAIAFPLDSYWHSLYGIDVAIWAPFHVMIIVAAACIPLGALILLVSATRLLAAPTSPQLARIGTIGSIVALACMFSMFTYLIPDALKTSKYLHLGIVTLNFFPLLAGLLCAWIFVAAASAFPQRRAATSVVLVYVIFAFIFQLFVPPATNALVASEHLHYTHAAGSFIHLSYIALHSWLLAPILVAPLVDIFFLRAQRRNWSNRRRTLVLALCCLPACIPLIVIPPNQPITWLLMLGVIGLPLSLLLGLLGTWTGTLLGQRMGNFLYHLEKEG